MRITFRLSPGFGSPGFVPGFGFCHQVFPSPGFSVFQVFGGHQVFGETCSYSSARPRLSKLPLAGATAALSPQQPVQPRRLLRLIEAFEHPDIEGPFGDGREEALAVGMQTEPRDGVGRRGQIQGREHLVRAALHINRVKPPLSALARRALEDAIKLGSVFRKREGL